MRFYLSGGMEYKKGLGKNWRENITKRLEEVGHAVFDPVSTEMSDQEAMSYNWPTAKLDHDLTVFKDMVRRKMFQKDIWGIQISDAIILLYDESAQKGGGTLAEAWEGFREGKPVYVITHFPREQVPGWLIGESTKLFKSPKEVVAYVSNVSQVEQDIKDTEWATQHYLGDIYKK